MRILPVNTYQNKTNFVDKQNFEAAKWFQICHSRGPFRSETFFVEQLGDAFLDSVTQNGATRYILGILRKGSTDTQQALHHFDGSSDRAVAEFRLAELRKRLQEAQDSTADTIFIGDDCSRHAYDIYAGEPYPAYDKSSLRV